VRHEVFIMREITDLDLAYIAVTAAEGGVNYWARTDGYTGRFLDVIEENPQTQWPLCFSFFNIIFENPISDEPPFLTAAITPQVLMNGIRLFLEQGRTFYDMEEFGAMDADEADVIVQLGLFGEVVFG